MSAGPGCHASRPESCLPPLSSRDAGVARRALRQRERQRQRRAADAQLHARVPALARRAAAGPGSAFAAADRVAHQPAAPALRRRAPRRGPAPRRSAASSGTGTRAAGSAAGCRRRSGAAGSAPNTGGTSPACSVEQRARHGARGAGTGRRRAVRAGCRCARRRAREAKRASAPRPRGRARNSRRRARLVVAVVEVALVLRGDRAAQLACQPQAAAEERGRRPARAPRPPARRARPRTATRGGARRSGPWSRAMSWIPRV